MNFNPLEMLATLMFAHYVLDYPWQGDFIARAKSRTAPIPGVPWYQILTAHAYMQGFAVGAITGVWWLGLAEFAVHAITDDTKCAGRLTFNQDQTIHMLCKVLWVAVVFLAVR